MTGTEVLTGRVQDRNGPWLADRLLELGIELAHITICGDRPADMLYQLEFMKARGMDLVITSGGLGPTADDLTAAVVGDFQGRDLRLDDQMEEKIWRILQPLMKRWKGIDPEAIRESNRKQAMVPEGAVTIDPAGTAPGLVVPPPEGGSGPTVVVLPGPPRELHSMWPVAVETAPFQSAVAGRTVYRQDMLRLFGIPESEIAETLRVAEPQLEGFAELEITTCLRRGEVEVVVRHDPGAATAWEGLRDVIRERHADTLFSDDGTSVDEQVFSLLSGKMVATAESCTGGLMGARLTDMPGSSAHVAGGVVSYSNEAKTALLDVDAALIEVHGAVSPQVALAMADGALSRFGSDVAVAITGVAGPGGGTEEKPVGYVCWCVKAASGETIARDRRMPGDRREIRDRSTTVAMHMLRLLLRGEQPTL